MSRADTIDGGKLELPADDNIFAVSEQKKAWIERLELKDKDKILFELEILLKGLDRFFNISNLPLANMEQVISLEFNEEIKIVLDFVERVVELSGKLLEASRREDYQFRNYVSNKLLGDYERTRWREAVLKQAEPEDSLFMLYSTFASFKEIIRGLSGLHRLPYSIFFNVGGLISREILANRYFNPARAIEFKPEYDKVANKKIGRIIRAIDDPLLQRQVSVVVLAFHRLLLYLRFIDQRSEAMEILKSSLLFFALIHSEAKYLREFMEKNLPRALKAGAHPLTSSFLTTCDSLSFQLQMELKKIHAGELLNISRTQKLSAVKISVENSHGIFTNFFQQSIIQVLKTFEPGLSGEEIFPIFISRRRQSIKVREDLAVLQSLMNKFEELIETTAAGTQHSTFAKYLILQKGIRGRIKKDTAPLMRYQDLVEFDKYFHFIEALTADELHIMDHLDKFKMESKFFKVLLDTTLGHIDNRAELQNTPLDEKRVERMLVRFISIHLKD